jgi:hypothetical protein
VFRAERFTVNKLGDEMPRKKKHVETEFERQQASDKKTREEVFAKLWADKKYQRIQAFKDAALRAWNIADAYKNRTSGGLEKAAKADARVKRALSRMYAAERVALEKAGLSY